LHGSAATAAIFALQHCPHLLTGTGAMPPERNPTMLVAIINFLRAWRRYNAGLTELSQLGDRELADIGITRSDIPRIAWENANW
jgi:uncharacterized protein YjiS (DUF1127 family)